MVGDIVIYLSIYLGMLLKSIGVTWALHFSGILATVWLFSFFGKEESIIPSIPSIPRTAKENLQSSTARNGEKGLN